MSESQKVTQQKALTTASGRTWLIVAGVIGLLSVVLLWFMRELEPTGTAAAGIVAIVVAYLVMIAVRFGVAKARSRLWALAILTLGISGTFITVASVIILNS